MEIKKYENEEILTARLEKAINMAVDRACAEAYGNGCDVQILNAVEIRIRSAGNLIGCFLIGKGEEPIDLSNGKIEECIKDIVKYSPDEEGCP